MSRFSAAGPSNHNHTPSHDFNPFAQYSNRGPSIGSYTRSIPTCQVIEQKMGSEEAQKSLEKIIPGWKDDISFYHADSQFQQVKKTVQQAFLSYEENQTNLNIEKVDKNEDFEENIIDIRLGYKENVNIDDNNQNLDVVIDIEMKDEPNNDNKSSASSSSSELALIMDVSYSMDGTPLANSILAVNKLIDKLNPDTYLHIITYATESKKVFSGKMDSEENILQAKIAVNAIKTCGNTNMSSGILEALKAIILSSNYSIRNKRMFLFTDGQVNCGLISPDYLYALVKMIHLNLGINTTSFGFGNDFNESLMQGISSAGKGDYFFIDGPEDVDYKVSKGLQVLQSLYAINAKLSISSLSPEFVSISKIYNFNENSEDDTVFTASLGDLCYDDLRQILCSINLKNFPRIQQSIEFIHYSLSYSVLDQNGSIFDNEISGSISIFLTCDSDKFNFVPDSLRVASAIQQANELEKKTLTHVNSENYPAAIECKKTSIKILQEIVDIDTTGVVCHLIDRGNSTLKKLETDKDRRNISKDIGYSAYQGSIVHRKCF